MLGANIGGKTIDIDMTGCDFLYDNRLNVFNYLMDDASYHDIDVSLIDGTIKQNRLILSTISEVWKKSINFNGKKSTLTLDMTRGEFQTLLNMCYSEEKNRIDAITACNLIKYIDKYNLPSDIIKEISYVIIGKISLEICLYVLSDNGFTDNLDLKKAVMTCSLEQIDDLLKETAFENITPPNLNEIIQSRYLESINMDATLEMLHEKKQIYKH